MNIATNLQITEGNFDNVLYVGRKGNKRNTIEEENIAFNLNFDMLESDNVGRFVHRAKNAPVSIRTQCGTIQIVFEEFFKDQGIIYGLTSLTKQSEMVFSFCAQMTC